MPHNVQSYVYTLQRAVHNSLLLPMVIVIRAQLYLVNKHSLLVMINTLCLDHQTLPAYQMANGVIHHQHAKVRLICDESAWIGCVYMMN